MQDEQNDLKNDHTDQQEQENIPQEQNEQTDIPKRKKRQKGFTGIAAHQELMNKIFEILKR